MRRPFSIFLMMVVLLAYVQVCFAVDNNSVTIIAEGSYIMGDGETMNASEQRAVDNARRAAIEQAGVYVESYSKTENLQLSKDEVNVISAGLIQSRVIDKSRTIVADGAVKLWCKVECVIKVDTIADMKARLGDKQLINQYNDLQVAKAQLDKENAELKLQLQQATSDSAKKTTEVKIAQNEGSTYANSLMEQAALSIVAGDYQKAITLYSQLLGSRRIKVDGATVYNNRGMAYAHERQYEQAIKDYSQAIKLKPDYAAAYLNRGNTYAKTNQDELARADWQMVKKLDNNLFLQQPAAVRDILI